MELAGSTDQPRRRPNYAANSGVGADAPSRQASCVVHAARVSRAQPRSHPFDVVVRHPVSRQLAVKVRDCLT